MGFPSPAADHADQPLSLDAYLIPTPAATFFWRYMGSEMDLAGIGHGALLIIDRSLDPRAGDVVAVMHRGEPLVRRLQKKGPGYQLVTEPIQGKPSSIYPQAETIMWGVVTHAVNTLRAGATRTARYADVSDGQG